MMGEIDIVADASDYFHPLIKKWFSEKFSRTTDIQEKAWPLIAQGHHVLITAPTGSGKTLTAFLWFINRLVLRDWSAGSPQILYISPLKALNNDIKKNLDEPLEEIREMFEKNRESFPGIRVMTRSGDTPQEDRRKMLRHPPDILITTPESLNLMLSSRSGQTLLTGLKAVILDEIHAVAGNKRGVHLITAVERLVRLSGEFQRIALSATIKGLDEMAAFIGGYRPEGHGPIPRYVPRPVDKIESGLKKTYGLSVRYPKRDEDAQEETAWDFLAKECLDEVEKNKSTLIFTNGRRLCEKLTYKINRLSGEPLAYSHHGSLSKQLRLNVEQNLKQGGLKAIVATSSLEMGIDIGDLSAVILVQSAPSVSSAIQRIGRAGHHVDRESRGLFYSPHPHDLICAAALTRAVHENNLEPLEFITSPLDVLAQVLISMTGLETWDLDELYYFLKTSRPFHHLSRTQYDLVLNMLAGRYADARIRELRPRVSIDLPDHTVSGTKGALAALYTSGGTIPDRGYYQLRHHETQARIGDLDEEYVWEAKIGQIATVGTQNWKILKITHNDVFAVPVGNSRMDAPFWIAESLNRDFHFSNLILEFLKQADAALSDPVFETRLKTEFFMDDGAAKELIRFLKEQKSITQCALPHRHHFLIEYVRSGPDGSPGAMLVIHTLLGGRVNRPYAMALEAAWEEKFKETPEIFPGNDAIIIQLPRPMEPEDLFGLVTSSNVDALIRQKLESTGFFAARFRECAARALLLTKTRINQRMPLWMTRLKSKKLLEAVVRYEDFPILLETYRTCLEDEFDLLHLKMILDEIAGGQISWSATFTSRPSPFAAGMAWNQINQYMYRQDEPARRASSLSSHFLRSMALSPDLAPRMPAGLVKEFEEKRQRLAAGYAPETARDLTDFVKERLAIPEKEWNALCLRIRADAPELCEDILAKAQDKLTRIYPENAHDPLVVSLEYAPKLEKLFYGTEYALDPENEDTGILLFSQWMSFYGPVTREFIEACLGIDPSRLEDWISRLVQENRVITGSLLENGTDLEICDSENFEILLRRARQSARPAFSTLDIEYLPLFLAHYQGLTGRSGDIDSLFDRVAQLICLPQNARSWEADILPARIFPYHPSFLDTLMQEGGLEWLGYPNQKTAFYFKPDMDLLPPLPENPGASEGLLSLFASKGVRYDFTALMGLLDCDSKTLTERIWNLVFQGRLSNETFFALRKGIENGFKPSENTVQNTGRAAGRQTGRRGSHTGISFSRWRGSLPLAGHWYRPVFPSKPLDAMGAEELNKDRVRLLLDRYGILFREILVRELPEFRWPAVFRSLRIMELSGEIFSGFFFKDIPGPQFIHPKALQSLQAGLPENAVYFMSAADPASVCGIPLPALSRNLPRRLSTTLLVFQGKTVTLISFKNGNAVEILTKPDDPCLIEYLACLKHFFTRPVCPEKKITITTINRQPAIKSPFLKAFEIVFDVLPDLKTITLYPKPV